MTKAKLTASERERVREREQLRKHYIDSGCPGLINEYADAPRWRDEEAQLEYVRKRILAGWTLVFPYRPKEQLAIEAALRGKPQKLADLIRQPDTQLAPSTRALVAEFLSGERNLHTGRAKGEAGRPRWSEKQRRAFSPTHRATEIFLLLRDMLPMIYPKRSKAHIHDRAMLLATMMVKGVSTEAIQIHLNKSKADRPPYRIYGHHEEDSPREFVLDLL
jgi:hypothetical protein